MSVQNRMTSMPNHARFEMKIQSTTSCRRWTMPVQWMLTNLLLAWVLSQTCACFATPRESSMGIGMQRCGVGLSLGMSRRPITINRLYCLRPRHNFLSSGCEQCPTGKMHRRFRPRMLDFVPCTTTHHRQHRLQLRSAPQCRRLHP